MWEDLEILFCNREDLPIRRLLLWGPPGTGKTSFAASLARRLGREIFSITLTGDSMVQELLGHWIPRGQEFIWLDGPAVKAWRQGAVLVLNEIDQAAGPVATFLLAVLDDPNVARIDLPTGEVLRPHRNFIAVATTNAHPQELLPALKDRFEIIAHITTPHPEALALLPLDLQNAVLQSYQAFAKGAESLALTFREALAFHRLSASLGDREKAASLVFGDRAKDILNALNLGPRG